VGLQLLHSRDGVFRDVQRSVFLGSEDWAAGSDSLLSSAGLRSVALVRRGVLEAWYPTLPALL
jgi:hypothetical protein